ncbi:MAG: DUF429 domain-containing protein [Actinomycetes bacterium]
MPDRSAPADTGPTVAGVDGCRAGWVVALADATTDGPVVRSVEVVASLADVLAQVARRELQVVALDMPVGLSSDGPRTADQEARAALGPRRSSVFPAPVRAVLDAVDHPDAVARSRDACGAGIPVQAWYLVPKVREVDELLRAAPARVRQAVRETHPELAFSLLGDGPCRHAKRTVAGRRERLARLRPWVSDRWTTPSRTPAGAARDDVLDALALAVRAAQWSHAGPAPLVLGGGTDEHGLPMQMWG